MICSFTQRPLKSGCNPNERGRSGSWIRGAYQAAKNSTTLRLLNCHLDRVHPSPPRARSRPQCSGRGRLHSAALPLSGPQPRSGPSSLPPPLCRRPPAVRCAPEGKDWSGLRPPPPRPHSEERQVSEPAGGVRYAQLTVLGSN